MPTVYNNNFIKPIRRAGIFAAATAFVFWAFFQLSKIEVIGKINPFGEDPVDAIGSIAVQAALLIGILTLARTARLGKGSQSSDLIKSRLVVRGCFIVISAVFITLSADLIEVIIHPFNEISISAILLVAGLILVCLIASFSGIILKKAAKLLPESPSEAADGRFESLSEALNDLFLLALSCSLWLQLKIPLSKRLLGRLETGGFVLLETLQKSSISPIHHPWRFYLTLGTIAGLILGSVNVFEDGFPTNFAVAILIMIIFVGVEIAATFLGVLVLGRFLGLRPYAD